MARRSSADRSWTGALCALLLPRPLVAARPRPGPRSCPSEGDGLLGPFAVAEARTGRRFSRSPMEAVSQGCDPCRCFHTVAHPKIIPRLSRELGNSCLTCRFQVGGVARGGGLVVLCETVCRCPPESGLLAAFLAALSRQGACRPGPRRLSALARTRHPFRGFILSPSATL